MPAVHNECAYVQILQQKAYSNCICCYQKYCLNKNMHSSFHFVAGNQGAIKCLAVFLYFISKCFYDVIYNCMACSKQFSHPDLFGA